MPTLYLLTAAPLLALLAAPAQDDMGWTGVLDEAAFAALHELKEGAAPALRGRPVDLAGTRAYLSMPPVGDPVGAVVVIHEWWGLNDHVKHWADRLASDGYAALAVDLYGGVVATTRDEAMAAMRGVDEEEALARLGAAVAHVRDGEEGLGLERVACIGWCFGGGWSLRLAMADPDLDAAVVYYGRLVDDPQQLASIGAPMLGVFGDQDTGIPPAAVESFAAAMKAAGNELEVRRYDAPHAFANPSSARYDAESASAAWAETRAFLCAHLTPALRAGSFARGTRALEIAVPEGWSRGAEREMRLATFEVPGGAECSVSVLAGNGGGVRANLDRWRAQMGAELFTDAEFEGLPRVPLFGRLAPSLRVEGTYRGMGGKPLEDAALLGAVALLEDEAVFVKLTGPRAAVDAAGESFAALCRGLK